jgi:hypothetical protein
LCPKRAEAAGGGGALSPEVAQAKTRMSEAFEAMEDAYRAAREEMNVHLTPKALDPNWRAAQAGSASAADLAGSALKRSRREELCSASWWWETDETRRYAEADRAMAEGEKQRKQGYAAEALAEEERSVERFVEAAKGFERAWPEFQRAFAQLRKIRYDNPESFVPGA